MTGRLLLLLLTLMPALLCAEERYVTDQFKITMRSGESTSHKIIKMLLSGSKLELLEENPESNYSKVRTQDNEVGYVLSRHLLMMPAARERLASAEKRIQRLQHEQDQLKKQLVQLREEHQQLQVENDASIKQKNLAETELEKIKLTAADAIKISNQRNALADKISSLNIKVDDLTQENTILKDRSRENWFMIGAGVITAGIILGLLLPHLRLRRRKSSWGSL